MLLKQHNYWGDICFGSLQEINEETSPRFLGKVAITADNNTTKIIE